MKPGTALIATVVAIVVVVVGGPWPRLSFCTAAALAHWFICLRSTGIVRFSIWIALFAGPLFLIHATLNANFPATGVVLSIIPYRATGAMFALEQASLVMTMFVPALYWLSVPREGVIALVSRLPISPPSAAPAFDAVSLIGEVDRRAYLILEAQQARGIRVNGTPWMRGAAILALIIPLVATLFRDAPIKAKIRHDLSASEAAFRSSNRTPLWDRHEVAKLAVLLMVAVVTYGTISACLA